MIDYSPKPGNEWRNRPHFYVEIISMKEMKNGENKFDVFQGEADDVFGATRIVNTFKPKRGYVMVTARIDTMGSLFDFD